MPEGWWIWSPDEVFPLIIYSKQLFFDVLSISISSCVGTENESDQATSSQCIEAEPRTFPLPNFRVLDEVEVGNGSLDASKAKMCSQTG